MDVNKKMKFVLEGKFKYALISFIFFVVLVFIDLNFLENSTAAFANIRIVLSLIAFFALFTGVSFILFEISSKIEQRIIKNSTNSHNVKLAETFLSGRFKPWSDKLFWRFSHSLTVILDDKFLNVKSIYPKIRLSKHIDLFPNMDMQIPISNIRKIEVKRSLLWPLTKTFHIHFKHEGAERSFIVYLSLFGVPRSSKDWLTAFNGLGLRVVN